MADYRALAQALDPYAMDTGGITPDTIKALQTINKSPNLLGMIADIGRGGLSNLESLVRGGVAQVPGTVGDLETLGRMGINTSFGAGGVKVSPKAVMPTTSDILGMMPQRVTQARPETAGMEELGTMIAPGLAKAAAPVVKGGGNLLGMAINERMLTGQPILPSLAKEPQSAMFAVNPTERGIVREGNPIQSAVVLIGDKIFTGRTHGDALNRAIYEGVVRKEGGKFIYPKGAEIDQDLFMTKDGQIIDRLQASKMLDIGASETAIEKGLMQNNPASSMTVDSYMQQAKKLKQQKEALPVEKTGLPSLQIEDKVLPVTMHKLEEKAGNQIVNISPETFDKAFAKTDWQYVGKGGEGGIEGRYKGFENWLKDAKSMTASNVSVNKDGGIVFGDGRHRYAVLRDMGLDKLPISMDKESIANAKKFGYLAE